MRISNFKLGIGVPLSFPMVPSDFFESFICMEKPPFDYYRASDPSIEEMRNSLVLDALAGGASHLIMMDTDQVYHPKTITRLLSHKKLVVGCLVYRRYPPFDPLIVRGTPGAYQTITEWEPNSTIPVDATGTGCLLFDMRVFRVLPYPWFRFRNNRTFGEDYGFCFDLRSAGHEIYVDTSVPADHLTKLRVNDGTWRLYRRLKELEVAAHKVEHDVVVTQAPLECGPVPTGQA